MRCCSRAASSISVAGGPCSCRYCPNVSMPATTVTAPRGSSAQKHVQPVLLIFAERFQVEAGSPHPHARAAHLSPWAAGPAAHAPPCSGWPAPGAAGSQAARRRSGAPGGCGAGWPARGPAPRTPLHCPPAPGRRHRDRTISARQARLARGGWGRKQCGRRSQQPCPAAPGWPVP